MNLSLNQHKMEFLIIYIYKRRVVDPESNFKMRAFQNNLLLSEKIP